MKRKLLSILTVLILMITLAACTQSANTTNLTEYTPEQLALYDGLNGAKAYVAVDGIIYDVTNASGWTNGSHQGMHLAGTDATAVFAQSPHSAELLATLPIVGKLVASTTNPPVTVPETYLPVFTLTELAQYTGANGTTAYVAVSGVVYDVTNAANWVNGTHQGMQLAGTDATAIFASSPHSQALLDTLPVVGSLEGYPQIVDPNPTVNPPDPTVTYLPVFTMTQLATYTGANGTTAYVAVAGVIYDVTNAANWVNGTHQGMQLAGTDATAIFASSPHSQALLDTLPVVGSLEGYPQIVDPNSTVNPPDPTVTYLPVFTMAQLAQYTGANGTTAYIAVSGVIYDVTNESNWVNGTHQGMQLGGTDATAIFAASPHSASTLASLTVVGSLEGYPLIDASTVNNNTNNGGDDDDDDYDDNDDYDDDDDDHDDFDDDDFDNDWDD